METATQCIYAEDRHSDGDGPEVEPQALPGGVPCLELMPLRDDVELLGFANLRKDGDARDYQSDHKPEADGDCETAGTHTVPDPLAE